MSPKQASAPGGYPSHLAYTSPSRQNSGAAEDSLRLDLSKEEVAEISRLALCAAEWSPAVAFCTAESYTLGFIQVRRELEIIESQCRHRALMAVHRAEQGDEDDGVLGAGLAALDSMNEFVQDKTSIKPEPVIQMLQECDMAPAVAATKIWVQHTGLHPEGGKFQNSGVKASGQPPQLPKPPVKHLQPPKVMRANGRQERGPPSRSTTPSKRTRKRDECSVM
eukprot:TRINITY_DN26789_c1_g1_i1.p1 TRINITY_DN26789_c1_g1~~TRINITY_DN26789_c1_g1_i1.p1  ORF type:complete len:255 (-),score=62.15 TRINITY_DN26789_c1_g1_i1:133-798(-)